MIRLERVERIGEPFLKKGISLPSPNLPALQFSKTFDFIESLFAGFWG